MYALPLQQHNGIGGLTSIIAVLWYKNIYAPECAYECSSWVRITTMVDLHYKVSDDDQFVFRYIIHISIHVQYPYRYIYVDTYGV